MLHESEQQLTENSAGLTSLERLAVKISKNLPGEKVLYGRGVTTDFRQPLQKLPEGTIAYGLDEAAYLDIGRREVPRIQFGKLKLTRRIKLNQKDAPETLRFY